MDNSFKINGTIIKAPHEFTIERYNLTKAGRAASGTMYMDLIAKKRRFVLRYEVLSSTQLQHILNLIDTNNMFFTFAYEEDGTAKTATCYVGAIPSLLHRKGTGIWYWKNVSFNVIER